MSKLPHDDIKPFTGEGSKKEQVSEMFDRIAPRYDFMNRFLSVGIDRIWRRKAIRFFKKDKPIHLLDVATGTADMAIMAAKILSPAKITGIDISEGMLKIGRKKIEKENLGTKIVLSGGDGETINFPPDTFDGVMVAFGVRNFEHLEKGLQEILRVMKPGAQLVVVEFSKPRIPGVKGLYNFYMGVVAPQLAKWFNQNKKAYQYLNESAKAFPDRRHFVSILNKTGYSNTYYQSLSLGICCIYSARKPVAPNAY
ncbi:bifunctional demethylmenaquinone methyltransferase/2-methoxy-6-polyprenyl-1,4-benzoquinol methylase UbiE [Flavisolibacter ginsenosidimutans]|uniref:Demethylmenaquinone methyltransferase n=1 Tax=Flavisolibacter ginsenosidimutans TaxID=661481 RepID=A0A5B8UH88_9BACT|nr:bifunctional demethylmenaquinone methyltransferase/2-methoxy-6-polyprenyl-1,4-benzoquinol methylase UbiE [Flavisolibacter ginsenosidimutans]QEC55858.1 bifunctional demethylmenaquinone methyltransferase/2-methoxy-6-polyprenyl-1,4-benzoquinol methylase UbiE [Flavisolibacter ginsenosidimutans]